MYNGAKSDRRSATSSSNVFVSDGKLVLRSKKTSAGWTTAGVSSARGLKQKYGKYEVRARLDRGYGLRSVMLLWPADTSWPPEVDFWEFSGRDPLRTTNHLTSHWGTASSRKVEQKSYEADFTQWHTVGVEWTPTALRYTLDGRVMATMTGAAVPQERMWLGMQTNTGSCALSACPNASTPNVVDFEIDWVKVYRRN